MTDTQKKFLELLYNPGELFCASPDKFGYKSLSLEEIEKEKFYLQLPDGSMHLHNIDDIELVSINPINGFRRDENVTSFRNFMVEIDNIPLSEQIKYIEDLGLPYSASVFSGSKSIHFVVSLIRPLPNESMWRYVAEWILNIVSKADAQNKNPSRSVRFPDVKRKSGKMMFQKMIKLNRRIDQGVLSSWLNRHEDKKPKIVDEIEDPDDFGHIATTEDLPRFVKDTLMELHQGTHDNRNATWFKLAIFLNKKGFSKQETFSFFEKFFVEERDFKKREWRTCINSAFKKGSFL